MHFVQYHKAVVAGKARVDGAHPLSNAVATEQQTRAELVYSGYDDPGLVRTVRPLVVNRDTAS